MTFRSALAALGAGITTFLVVAVLVIELLDVEFSAIVGLPVGAVAGWIVICGKREQTGCRKPSRRSPCHPSGARLD